LSNAAEQPERQPRSGSRIFSQRLEEFLERLREGEVPNSGSFCSYCYNPLPPGYSRCDHCGQDLSERPPITSLPDPVLRMYRRKINRESWIVNTFAFIGLGLGMVIFLGMVAINVTYMDKALWFFILATIVFLVGSRILAGVIGGIIGDEIGYRVANRHLAEDWAAFVTEREAQRGHDAKSTNGEAPA
jgi:hypothetical protein